MSDVPLEPAPFCSACGYDLSGAIESSKCPECGRPLVEVLVRDEGAQTARRRYQSERTFLGLPLVSVAFGRDANGKPGHAKGWLAIGDKATGVFAMGGRAFGVVALGGIAIGVLAFGGVSIGLLIAAGGFAAALGFAFGGLAVGSLAAGGFAIGYMAIGGMVIAAHGIGGFVVGGKGLPFNVNIRSLMATMLYVSLGIGVISALPGIIGALIMRGASKRNQS